MTLQTKVHTLMGLGGPGQSLVYLAIEPRFLALGDYAGARCSIPLYSITFTPIDCQTMGLGTYTHKTNSVSAPEFHPCSIDCEDMIWSFNIGLII